MIKAKQITKTLGSLQILKGIDLEIAHGEIVSIVGPSGAGKTTLLQILGTLSEADAGSSLHIEGHEVQGLSERSKAELRNRSIGFVFQSHQLLPEFTALENVIIPALISGLTRAQALARGRELLQILGLSERSDHKPNQMSGGECQRVAVARAMINRPAVVLADEPSGSLDTHNKELLHQLFFDLRKQFGQTFVIVTHDVGLAERADRMICLKDGRIERIVTQKNLV